MFVLAGLTGKMSFNDKGDRLLDLEIRRFDPTTGNLIQIFIKITRKQMF